MLGNVIYKNGVRQDRTQLEQAAQQRLATAVTEALYPPEIGTTHTAQAKAQTGIQSKRTRQGTNRVYARLNGTIAATKFCQAIGARIGKGKEMVPLAAAVLKVFGYGDVGESSIKTALYDGATPVTKNGVNLQHKPAVLTAELAEQLDAAIEWRKAEMAH